MPDLPPARETYGELHPVVVGDRIVIAQIVTDPDQQDALEQWEQNGYHFAEQMALHPDSPIGHDGELIEPPLLVRVGVYLGIALSVGGAVGTMLLVVILFITLGRAL